MTSNPSDTPTARPSESQSSPSVQLDTTVTFRLSFTEKELLASFARKQGLSVGRYLIALMKANGKIVIEELTANARLKNDATRKPHRRSRKKATLASIQAGFQVPFLQRKHANAFRRSIEYAASKADVSAYSVAWVASHLFESIAREVATGEIVRIPGFVVVGPWRIEERGICVPRFQSCQAFTDYLLVDGERNGANESLQAHRRRKRNRLQNLPKAMAAFRSRVESQNRRLLEGFEAWHEYGSGAGLY